MAHKTWKFRIVESRRRRRFLSGAGEDDDDRNQSLRGDEKEEKRGTMRRQKEEGTGDEENVELIEGQVGVDEQQEPIPSPKMEVLWGVEKNTNVDVDVDCDDGEPRVSLMSVPGTNAPFSSASRSRYTAVTSGTSLDNTEDAACHGVSLSLTGEMIALADLNTFVLSTEDSPLAAVVNVTDDQMSSTVKITSGIYEYGEVFTLAGVQVRKSKMVDASTNLLDMPKMGTEPEVDLNNMETDGDGEVAGGSNSTGRRWEQGEKPRELERSVNFIKSTKRAYKSIHDEAHEKRGKTSITSVSPCSSKAHLAEDAEEDTDFGSENDHVMEFCKEDDDNPDHDEEPSISAEMFERPSFESANFPVRGEIGRSAICYRLVQIVGTRLQAEPYKLARKDTNLVLEVVNLQKKEHLKIDRVSNEDCNEEECQRLRQSIKCGFIKALTVGDIQDKERSLRELKLNDWIRTEEKRLMRLQDCASEKGLTTELRKCVERLQKLDSPTYLASMVQPEVISDPRMHPDYNSDNNDDDTEDEISKILDKSFSSPGVMILPVGKLKGIQNESSRHLEGTSNNQATRRHPYHSQEGDGAYNSFQSSDKLSCGEPAHRLNIVESAEGCGSETKERARRKIEQQNHITNSVDTKRTGNGRNGPITAQKLNEKVDLSNSGTGSGKSGCKVTTESVKQTTRESPGESACPCDPSSLQRFPLRSPIILTQAAIEATEEGEIWHYIDPTSMIQGPFSMEQLRKWKSTGYFPEELRVWRTTRPREESILLTDALAGHFENERESLGQSAGVGVPCVSRIIPEEIARNFTASSTLPSAKIPTMESADGWRENGGASSWTDQGQSNKVGRSASYGSLVMNLNNRNFKSSLGRPLQRYQSTVDKPVVGPRLPHHHPKAKQAHKAAAMLPSCNYCGEVHKYSECNIPATELFCNYCEKQGHREQVCFARHPERKQKDSECNIPATELFCNYCEKQGHREQVCFARHPERKQKELEIKQNYTRLAPRKDFVCRYFAKGYCKRGANCDYRHG